MPLRRSAPATRRRHGAKRSRPERAQTRLLPLPAAAMSNEISSLLTPPVESDLPASSMGRWRGRRKWPAGGGIFPFGIRPGLLGRDGDEVAQGAEPGERLAFELADALPRQVELVPDRLEGPRLALEAEPQLEDPPLPLREGVERTPHALAAERLLGLLERIGGLAVGEEIAELALVVRAHRLVQRDGGVGGAEGLVDVLHGQSGRLGELLLRRLSAELHLEPARRARKLLLPFHDVDRDADRARVVRDRALHRLADPPGGVRRELVAAAPVELLDGAVEAERSLLDQVEERHTQAAVALRDRDDEAQVRLDHATLCGRVATLDALREHHFLGGGEQLVASDVGEEELQAVGGAGGSGDGRRRGCVVVLVGVLLLAGRSSLRSRDGRAHVETDPLELAGQLLDVLVVEVELEGERL